MYQVTMPRRYEMFVKLGFVTLAMSALVCGYPWHWLYDRQNNATNKISTSYTPESVTCYPTWQKGLSIRD